MKYFAVVLSLAFAAPFVTSCGRSPRAMATGVVRPAPEPTAEQMLAENAERERIGLRQIDTAWSFHAPTNRAFKGHEVWRVPTPDDPRFKTNIVKVVWRHPDGTIAGELDYYRSGRYFFLGAEGPDMEREGIHDEFMYTQYDYASQTLSLHYVGKDVEIYSRCKELNSQPREFAEVTTVTDELLAVWDQSRL